MQRNPLNLIRLIPAKGSGLAHAPTVVSLSTHYLALNDDLNQRPRREEQPAA
jgi:hypothetical protein